MTSPHSGLPAPAAPPAAARHRIGVSRVIGACSSRLVCCCSSLPSTSRTGPISRPTKSRTRGKRGLKCNWSIRVRTRPPVRRRGGRAGARAAHWPGHYPVTQLPGQDGNFAVAGHRVGKGAPFNDLGALEACDAVVVETKQEWVTYRVLPM
ncbi:sortase domain-bontaining protein [Corynebacterium ureicelerivorans]|uniref:sortase domain-containing protein n=1 Tax=Corynebacterium ureicelerivorans TaxID=401472 RepID=UPI0023544CBB|nr:sortase [Corynebacterium ureicelerivorans]